MTALIMLRGDLFKHFEKLEIDYFQHNKQGDLVARAINDLTAVRGLLGPGISNLMNTTVALPAKSRELAGGSLKGKVEFRHVSLRMSGFVDLRV